MENETFITINKIELASEMASNMMDEKMAGDPWMIYSDEEDTLIIDPKHQDQFNEFYDEALTLIDSCKVERTKDGKPA